MYTYMYVCIYVCMYVYICKTPVFKNITSKIYMINIIIIMPFLHLYPFLSTPEKTYMYLKKG